MTTSSTNTPLAPADDFVRRHVGPDDDELRHMLNTLGADSLDALLDETLPESIRDDALNLPAARSEPDVLSALRQLGAENAPRTSLIGMGYYPTVTPGGDPTQRAREPGLVHGVHPVSARDQPGPPGGLAQLPDDHHRADRLGGRQRIAARRGDGRRRGDEHGPPAVEVGVGTVLRPPRHPPADDRRAGNPGRARRDRARRRRRRRARCGVLRRAVQLSDLDRRPRRLA